MQSAVRPGAETSCELLRFRPKRFAKLKVLQCAAGGRAQTSSTLRRSLTRSNAEENYRFASSRNAASVFGTCSSGLSDEYA